MFRTISKWFEGEGIAQPQVDVCPVEVKAGQAMDAAMGELNKDPYLCIADEELRLISVFDDLKYDRADLDALSGPMRARVLSKLTPLGFRQVSGGVVENVVEDVRALFPKFRALGASPFDATRATPRRSQDYYILTPTQAACQLVESYPTDNAVAAIEALIIKHPVNLLRMADFLEKSERHQAFSEAIGQLMYLQRKSVESDPLCRRRALR